MANKEKSTGSEATTTGLTSSNTSRQPTIMERKFMNWHKTPLSESDENQQLKPNQFYGKEPYFFYGTLMDPETLMKVLNLKEQPELRQASIVGYHTKLWGLYPALFGGPCNAVVQGMVYEIHTPEQVQLLQDYETERYVKTACRIKLDDGSVVNGRTFMWRQSNRDEVHEGVFDLKSYQMETNHFI